ncbi:MAG: amino acid permease [Bacillales bacterium]|jgi:amino acid transporter|nr:amino acid permease [Bacillales bacterium]
MSFRNFKNFILGKPLANDQLSHQKLNVLWGLPVMASDPISSVAYAIEEILMVLITSITIGLTAYKYVPYFAIPIIVLLLTLIVSYAQIINHYPSGGGSYLVSADNFGKKAALLAGVALVVDYVMTVAVSISASTAAIVSAFPALGSFKTPFSLLCLVIITLLNLRGIRESSRIFGVPTYIFIFSMGIMIMVGFIRAITGTLTPIDQTIYANTIHSVSNDMMIIIFLRAFSSGCSALTGVEAVSNAIPNFREPAQRNAKYVLFILGGIIVFIFSGTAVLASLLHVAPIEGVTIVSQIGKAIFGHSFMFYILQFSTSLILLLATNTAYNDLPIVLSILAKDGYMPRQFAQRGTKLSFSNGIIFLLIVAGGLLTAFNSDTHKLIPFYAVGVFISFTLSQSGMVVKWVRLKEKGWQYKMSINAIGAVITFISLIVVFYFKFREGAWALAIVIPTLMFVMARIKRHYTRVGEQLTCSENIDQIFHKNLKPNNTPCIILIRNVNKASIKTLNYAKTISTNLTALHISDNDDSTIPIQEQWEKLNSGIRLDIIKAPYRDVITPLDEYLTKMEAKLPNDQKLTVIMTKFVESKQSFELLHNQTTYFLENRLSKHKDIITVLVPYIYEKD